MTLAGRRALITGGASGIGRAVARAFAAAGASVGLLDRDARGLEAVARELADAGAEVAPFVVDLRDAPATVRAVQACVDALQGLDAVVCAAGIDLERSTADTDHEAWADVLAINLTAPFVVVRAALPALKQASGATVVTVASGAGLRPIDGRPAYCASKAGLIMFTKAFALEGAPHGIRANAVCPGAIDTPLLRGSIRSAPDAEAARARIADRYPLGRIGEAGEVAAAVLYLTSDASSYVTGVALAVDGGRTMH